MSKYESSKSVGYRKPILIDSNDPRTKTEYDLEKYRSRSGSEVIVNESTAKNIDIEEMPTDCWLLSTNYTNTPYAEPHQFSFMATDSEENIVCAGPYYKKQDGTDDSYLNIVIAKFSKDGDLIWQIFLDDSIKGLSIRDIKIDKNDNIYITGTNNDANFDASFIAKFSKNGTKVWSKRIYIGEWGYSSYMAPSNIQFNSSETKIYLATSRIIDLAFSTDPIYVHVYEINMSSGSLIRSNRYYGYVPGYSFYQPKQAAFDENLSIHYTDSYLYIFGESFITIDYTPGETNQFSIIQINLSNFEIDSAVLTDESVYNYFTTQKYHSIFYKNKLYLCPRTGSYLHIYEYDGISLKNYRIDLGGVQSGREDLVAIYSFQQDSRKNFVLAVSGNNNSGIIKIDPISKKVKTFNTFKIKNPWGAKESLSYAGKFLSYYKGHIVCSSNFYMSKPWEPSIFSRARILFKIPYYDSTNQIVAKSNIKINFPEVYPGTYFYSEISKNFSKMPDRTIPLIPGYEQFKLSDDSLYDDTTYSVIRNDTKFIYEKTEF